MRRICACALVALLLCACTPQGGEALPELTLAIPKIGAADCIVLCAGGRCVVIDAGEKDDGGEIVTLLKRLGVRRVDLLIVTHFDKDHIGGVPELMEAFPVEVLLEPAYEKAENKTYRRYDEAAAAAGRRLAVREETDCGEWLAGMGVALRVYPPLAAHEGDNDNSLVITAQHGAVRMLFAGDAAQARGEELPGQLPEGPYALVKAPHHGRYHAVSEALLAYLAPSLLVITCSAKNPPEPEYLAAAQAAGVADVRLTADGDILLASDGERLR